MFYVKFLDILESRSVDYKTNSLFVRDNVSSPDNPLEMVVRKATEPFF